MLIRMMANNHIKPFTREIKITKESLAFDIFFKRLQSREDNII